VYECGGGGGGVGGGGGGGGGDLRRVRALLWAQVAEDDGRGAVQFLALWRVLPRLLPRPVFGAGLIHRDGKPLSLEHERGSGRNGGGGGGAVFCDGGHTR